MASITHIPHSSTEEHEDCWGRLPWVPKSMKDVLRTVFDRETFTSPTYALLLIATSLTMLGKPKLRLLASITARVRIEWVNFVNALEKSRHL